MQEPELDALLATLAGVDEGEQGKYVVADAAWDCLAQLCSAAAGEAGEGASSWSAGAASKARTALGVVQQQSTPREVVMMCVSAVSRGQFSGHAGLRGRTELVKLVASAVKASLPSSAGQSVKARRRLLDDACWAALRVLSGDWGSRGDGESAEAVAALADLAHAALAGLARDEVELRSAALGHALVMLAEVVACADSCFASPEAGGALLARAVLEFGAPLDLVALAALPGAQRLHNRKYARPPAPSGATGTFSAEWAAEAAAEFGEEDDGEGEDAGGAAPPYEAEALVPEWPEAGAACLAFVALARPEALAGLPPDATVSPLVPWAERLRALAPLAQALLSRRDSQRAAHRGLELLQTLAIRDAGASAGRDAPALLDAGQAAAFQGLALAVLNYMLAHPDPAARRAAHGLHAKMYRGLAAADRFEALGRVFERVSAFPAARGVVLDCVRSELAALTVARDPGAKAARDAALALARGSLELAAEAEPDDLMARHDEAAATLVLLRFMLLQQAALEGAVCSSSGSGRSTSTPHSAWDSAEWLLSLVRRVASTAAALCAQSVEAGAGDACCAHRPAMEVNRARRRFEALGRGTDAAADAPFRQPASLHEAGAPTSAADARLLLNASILQDQAVEVSKLLERRLGSGSAPLT